MFFSCILSATEKIMSSIKQRLWKMFITIIFCQVRITEFHTRQFKSFPNSKYLAITFSITFKVAVNILFFSFVHAPVCANCNYSCKLYIFQKKKKKNDPYFGTGKKYQSYATIPHYLSFLLGKGGNPYISKKLT